MKNVMGYLLDDIYWVYDENNPKTEVVPYIFNAKGTHIKNLLNGMICEIDGELVYLQPKEKLQKFLERYQGKGKELVATTVAEYVSEYGNPRMGEKYASETLYCTDKDVQLIAKSLRFAIRRGIKFEQFADRIEQKQDERYAKKQEKREAKEAKKEAKQKAKDDQGR